MPGKEKDLVNVAVLLLWPRPAALGLLALSSHSQPASPSLCVNMLASAGRLSLIALAMKCVLPS